MQGLLNINDEKQQRTNVGSSQSLKVKSNISDRRSKAQNDLLMTNITLSMMGSGQIYGDIDYVFNRCYTFSLRSVENEAQLFTIRSKDFEKVLRGHRDTWVQVEKICIQRNH